MPRRPSPIAACALSSVVLMLAAASAVGTPKAGKAPAIPKGAKVLAPDQLKTATAYPAYLSAKERPPLPVTCGRVNGPTWAGGTLMKFTVRARVKGKLRTKTDSYFVSFALQASAAGKELKAARAAQRRAVGPAKKAAGRRVRDALAKKKQLEAWRGASYSICNPMSSGPGWTNPNAYGPTKFAPMRGARGVAITTTETGAASLSRVARVGTRSTGTAAGIKKVLPSGSLENALVSGPVENIQRVIAAPNNKLYVLYSMGVVLGGTVNQYPSDQSAFCRLAEINVDTGDPTCVADSTINIWSNSFSFLSTDVVQTDAEGAIYYLGSVYRPNSSTSVLRRYLNGVTHNYIPPTAINPSSFIVMPNRDVIYSGYTMTGGSGSSWTRVASGASTSTEEILSAAPSWMATFPDGKTYVGVQEDYSAGTPAGVFRYNPEIVGLDATAIPNCTGLSPAPQVCTTPTGVRQFAYLSTGAVYALAGTGTGDTAAAYRYRDGANVLEQIDSGYVTNVKQIVAADSRLVMYGTTKDGLNRNRHVVTVWDPATRTETPLLNGLATRNQNYEVFTMRYRGGNEVWFDAFFSPNSSYGLGKLNVLTGDLRFEPTERVLDFSLF